MHDQNELIQTMINAIHVAQSRSAYKLDEAAQLHDTIEKFIKSLKKKTEPNEES